MDWVVAIEAAVDTRRRPPAIVGRVHAYDPLQKVLAHPIGCAYTVQEDQQWANAAPDRRCHHCTELAGL
jgi:hypothetical protein